MIDKIMEERGMKLHSMTAIDFYICDQVYFLDNNRIAFKLGKINNISRSITSSEIAEKKEAVGYTEDFIKETTAKLDKKAGDLRDRGYDPAALNKEIEGIFSGESYLRLEGSNGIYTLLSELFTSKVATLERYKKHVTDGVFAFHDNVTARSFRVKQVETEINLITKMAKKLGIWDTISDQVDKLLQTLAFFNEPYLPKELR